MRTPRALTGLPVLMRYAVVAGLLAGLIGCVAGLVIGLNVYAPTAWFATFELGVPAAMVGAVLGLLVGIIVLTVRRLRQAAGARPAR